MRTIVRPSLLLTFFLLLFLSPLSELMATHLVGGSLNYEYLGQNVDGTYRYRVYSVTYTDVGPTSNFDDPEDEIPVAVYANDLLNPDADKILITEFDMPLISITEVTLAGVPSGCTVGEDVTIERGDYEFLVDLPLNFDGYWLYYDRCCRNNAVVNLTPQQGVGFSTYIPSPIVENSSPFFNVDPVPFLCAGDTSSFLNSAVDPDGDQMVFSFITPFRGYSTDLDPNPGAFGYPNPLGWEVPSVDYQNNFSSADPFGPGGYAFINGATGLTSYMAPNAGQYAVAVEIKEYRNGNLIGIIRRDLQLVVINCPPNPAPDLSNVSAGNVGPTEWEIDEGDTLCFPVVFEDGNGDSLLLTAFGEVFDGALVTPTASINTPQTGEGTVQADFCWFTDCDLGRANPYFFGVTASDNGCPPKSASEVYSIEVIPFTGSTSIDGNSTPCETSTETYTTDVFVDGDYAWSVSGGVILSGQGTNTVTVDWGDSGAGTLSVTSTNFRGCVGDPFDLDIAILPLPDIDAGPDVSFCLGDTISIGGAPTGPAGSIYVWGPDEAISDINASNPDVSPTSNISYEVQVISANSCSARDTVEVTVNSTSAEAQGDEEICAEDAAFLQVITPADDILWTPGADLNDDTISNPIASPDMTTTYLVQVTDENGCMAEDSITVTVYELPIADAGMNDSICGFDYPLQAIPSIGTGQWQDLGGGVTFMDDTDPNTMVTAPNTGFFELIWIETNVICEVEDTVTIEFIDQPQADAGADGSSCDLEYTLQASPSIGMGEWLPTTGVTLSDSNDPNALLNAASYGTYVMEWVESNRSCRDTAQVTIDLVEQPTADAGMDDMICGDEYPLNATPSVGGGTWSGPAGLSFSDPNDAQATAITTIYGPQTLTWTEDNGFGCTSSASVVIEFNEIPISDAGPDDIACGLSYDLQANASAGSGIWVAPGGLTVTDITDPQSVVTADNYGTYTLTWTEDNAGCTDQDQVEITFSESPQADAGMDDTVCGDNYVLNATSSTGTGTWTAGPDVSFSDVNDPNALATSSLFGSQTLTWTEDNNGCIDQASIEVTFFEIPQADAGEDLALCGNEITLNASPSLGTGTWSGPAEVSFNDVNDPASTSTSTTPGSYILTWTEESNGCSASDDVLVEFLEVPVADAGEDELLCLNSSVQLQAQGGDEYLWTPDLDLDDPSIADPTASPTDTVTYTVTVSLDNGCSSTDELSIFVLDLPTVDAGSDVSYLCLGDSIQLQATPGFDAYTWAPDVGLSDPNIADPVAAPTIALEIEYVVLVEDENGCQNTDTVRVTVNPIVPTDAGPDTLICTGEPVVLGGDPTAPDGTEYAWTPTTAMNDSTLANPTVSPSETTTYTVFTDNSICSGQDEVTVIVEEIPTLDFQIEAEPGCDALRVRFNNLSDPELTYIWDLGDGTSSEEFSPVHAYEFNASYLITLTGQSELGCVYTRDEILDASDFESYFEIAVPNVFTPNGDGNNDVFDINLTGQVEDCFYMEIFNRWGQTMFLAAGNATRWDGFTRAGDPAAAGVYFYVIEFNGLSYKGSVQLIR
ncbi:MAG: T9SS type B sorting domain-containing protein [Flavobacteriales bacterium]|nr:T9SS type B sorting domain-containing protein [Flavobacteriales bacterium]